MSSPSQGEGSLVRARQTCYGSDAQGGGKRKEPGGTSPGSCALVHITILPEAGRRGIICIRGMRKKPRRFPEPRQKPGRTRRPRQPYYHDSPPVVKLRRAVFCYILLHDEVLRAIEEPPNLTGS